MDRRVERELLDELPASDPRAIRSRLDLQRLNSWMRNTQIMARSLSSKYQGRQRRALVEIGAGDGTFLLRVAQQLAPDWRRTTALLIDRQDIVHSKTRRGYEELGWHLETIASDIFDWFQHSTAQDCEIIVANLFLHHFSSAQLSSIFEQVARRARLFVAIEPRRWFPSVFCGRLVGLIGCNAVTRHDARASIRAGFSGNELSKLWPPNEGWSLEERPANLASHLFVAQKLS